MNKKAVFSEATEKVMTYGKVMQELNKISRMSGDDYAVFSANLKDVHGNKTLGFEFDTVQQEMQLADLLDSLGIKFAHYKADIKSQKGQLHIVPEFHKMATELFGMWSSSVIIEPRITGNAEIDARWAREVSHTR